MTSPPKPHRLEPLLRPRSVAVIGASPRADSMGEWALRNLEKGGYAGEIFPVNPRHEKVAGRRCYGAVADLPETPDLAVFAVGDHRVESVLDEVIDRGIPAAVIMSTLALDDDADPPLKDRVQEKIRASGTLVCGANGMGFYNVRDRVWACGFDSADHEPPGNVAIISHSGAGMSGIIDCEERLAINFAVSTGNELSVAMDEYLNFVLELPETRVVGLFIESIRNPQRFTAALEKAAEKRIPIVALKTGRTEQSARLTVSHSGALAGDDAVFDALFERYGVQRVWDQDEWTTALILFSTLWPVGDGGLVTLHDSGGERQLLIDLAAEAGVPLTNIGHATRSLLADVLPPELPAVNPLDAWSRGGEGAGQYMARCFALLTKDPDAAIGAVVHNRAPYGKVYASYLDYMETAHAESGKPVALVSARQGTGHDPSVVAATHAGFPVLDGLWPFLVGVRAMFRYRDFLAREPLDPVPARIRTVDVWRSRLREGAVQGEARALAMLEDFGIATSKPVVADSRGTTLEAARRIGYPVVIKTAKTGIAHKSEIGGVVTNIRNDNECDAAYAGLSAAQGPEVLVAPMIENGVEMLLGAHSDPQFGPVIVIGFGGVLAETLRDVRLALPPVDKRHARRLLDELRLRPLLDGIRGRPPASLEACCDAIAKFSSLVEALADDIAAFDINPLIVTDRQAVAVDALVMAATEPEISQ